MHFDDRREELLDRAYRRGYALRRRRRSTAALAALAAIAVVAAGVATLSSPAGDHKISVVQPPARVQPPCAAGIDAVPAAEVPSDVAAWADGRPVVGGGQLWTAESAMHVAGTPVGPAWDLKFPWFTKPSGLPQISARRLDGPGTFSSDVNHALDSRGAWVVSSLQFSTPGCWEVTGRFQSSTLTFRVAIGPVPTSAVFANQHDGLGLTFRCNVPSAADPTCDFSILSSSDAGRTWSHVGGMQGIAYAGWRGYPDIELAASGSDVWVWGTRTFASHDGGRTFQDARVSGIVSALVPEGDTVWATTHPCALCSTHTLVSAPVDGGAWTTVPGFPDLRDPYAVLVRPSATVAYVVGSDTHAVLYRTDDAGQNWQSRALPPPPPASPRTATVALAALGSDQVWMLDGGIAPGQDQEKALYRSDDGGQHWILLADTGAHQRPGVGQLPAKGLGLVLTVVTAQRIWIALDRGPFVGTLDGGATWFDTGITTQVEQVLFVDPLHGWAWNGGGYQTTDGTHWIPITG
jgi:photosystem II stability/assembly factor-like uncharacterized protein